MNHQYLHSTKYNHKALQTELGLNWYDYGARNYDASIGRWMNVDPLVEQTMSVYGYCNQNPVNLIDPTGMSAEWHPDVDGNLVADKGDNAQTLATYLFSTYSESLQILNDNGYSVNEKGILNLKVGDVVNTGEVHLPEVIIIGKKRGNGKTSAIPSNKIHTNLKSDAPWMDIAKSQLGIKERTGNNDGVQVEKYLKSGGLGKGYPWCGAFVNWTLKESKIKVSGVKGNPNWALNWRGFGQTLDRPAYGAIATKTRNGGGHVGFVAGITSSGKLVILGGNQSDMVNYTPYPANIFKFNYPDGYTPNYNLPVLNISGGKIKEN